jgi:class 3 adenylate cyclase/dihydrofolate reductase
VRLIVSEFVTLDGVMEAPGHEEHRDGKNAWALQGSSEEQEQFKLEELAAASGFLLGRVTYQIFQAYWPTTSSENEFAETMNKLDKYVVSSTLRSVSWDNTRILRGSVADEVSEIKQRSEGELLVLGSADLVDELMEHDLVDEIRLMVFPIVLGSGKRLFLEGRDTSHLRLVGTRTFDTGVVLLTYQPAGTGPTSPYAERYAWTDEQISSFQAAQNADRVLASILFTDIVDSTGRAAAIGDRRWRQLLERHDRAAKTEVDRFHGRLVKTTGDGILATFETPTRALQCAFGLMRSVAESGLGIRAAVHTGEIDVGENDVGGIGVHIASRVLGIADESRVVVTRTVRELATGTDLVFTSLGSFDLRGVPGQWELFEASTATPGRS